MEKGEHHILLVNFGSASIQELSKAGFKAELGYIGEELSINQAATIAYSLPHPVYEYDVYVFNSVVPKNSPPSSASRNLHSDPNILENLTKLGTRPPIRISFIGGNAGGKSPVNGVPWVELTAADRDLSVVLSTQSRDKDLQEFHEVLARWATQIELPVSKYVRLALEENKIYRYKHHPLLVNRNRDVIAAYGSYNVGAPSYDDLPVYFLLPQFKNNTAVLLEVLRTLARLRPELFPDLQKQIWLSSEDFAFAEEKAIDRAIQTRSSEFEEWLTIKQKEKEAIRQRFGFATDILTATEASELPPDRRLSQAVKKTLEFLEFQVEDIDAKIRGAIRKEDFWVKDAAFLAITEVSGTANKNPKTKEYNDLLGRMSTIFKRRDLLPDSSQVSGLLILNYDLENHPFARPRLYSGADDEIVEAAKENSIGLVSTVELYRIAVAAKDGRISKEHARALIKNFGRIEYPTIVATTPSP